MKNMNISNIRLGRWLLSLMLVVGLAGCGDDGQDKQQAAAKQAVAKFDLLSLVPNDAPYVMANSRHLPEELSRKLLKSSAFSLQQQGYRDGIEQMLSTGTDDQKKMARLAKAVLSELDGKLTPEGLASLGLPLNGRSLVYGMGVLPVAWIEILDGQKLEAAVSRIEKNAQMAAPKQSRGEWSYRRFDLGNLVAILEIRKDYAVMGLLPTKSEQDLLPVLLGEKKPQKSLADTGAFATFVSDHGFLGYGEGYVDLLQLAQMLMGESSGVNAQVLGALGAEPKDISPACKTFITETVQSAPLLSFGFTEASAQGYTIKGMVETSPEVSTWLKKMAAPVPGLGVVDDVMFSFGLGINLPQLRDGLKAMLRNIQENGKSCEMVDQQAITRSMQSMDMMFNPMFAGIKGFNLMVKKVHLDPKTMQPDAVDVRMVLESTDPQGMFGMLGMVSASFTQVKLSNDGTPVELPVKDLSPMAPPAWAASKNTSLALMLGDAAPDGMDALLDLPVAPTPPLFAMAYDAQRVLDNVGPALKAAMASMPDANAKELESAYASLQNAASLYGRVSVQLTGTDAGLVFEGRVELK